MLEASAQETDSVKEAASPKKNKRDESDVEEEDVTKKPVPPTPRRKKELDTCK